MYTNSHISLEHRLVCFMNSLAPWDLDFMAKRSGLGFNPLFIHLLFKKIWRRELRIHGLGSIFFSALSFASFYFQIRKIKK